jgi:hypothetical protein
MQRNFVPTMMASVVPAMQMKTVGVSPVQVVTVMAAVAARGA